MVGLAIRPTTSGGDKGGRRFLRIGMSSGETVVADAADCRFEVASRCVSQAAVPFARGRRLETDAHRCRGTGSQAGVGDKWPVTGRLGATLEELDSVASALRKLPGRVRRCVGSEGAPWFTRRSRRSAAAVGRSATLLLWSCTSRRRLVGDCGWGRCSNDGYGRGGGGRGLKGGGMPDGDIETRIKTVDEGGCLCGERVRPKGGTIPNIFHSDEQLLWSMQ